MGSAPESPRSVVRVIYGHQGGRAALVRIDNTAKLGALDQDGYFALAQAMREVAARPEVIVTVLTGTGRFFSAYVAVTAHIPAVLAHMTAAVTQARHVHPAPDACGLC